MHIIVLLISQGNRMVNRMVLRGSFRAKLTVFQKMLQPSPTSSEDGPSTDAATGKFICPKYL